MNKLKPIPGSRAINMLFFLNTMHKVKHEDWKVVFQERAYFTVSHITLHYAGFAICWTWKHGYI